MQIFEPKSIGEAFAERMSRHRYPYDDPVLTTSFISIDRIIGGFSNGKVTIITADKTTNTDALMTSFALRMAKATNRHIALFTTHIHQSQKEKFLRTAINNAADNSINWSDWREGGTKKNAQKMELLGAQLQKIPLLICDVINNEFCYLKYMSWKLVRDKGTICIFVDLLQALKLDEMVSVHSNEHRLQLLCDAFIRLAEELNIPIVLFAHNETSFQFKNYAHLLFDYKVFNGATMSSYLNTALCNNGNILPAKLSILFDTYGRTGEIDLMYKVNTEEVLPFIKHSDHIEDDSCKDQSTPSTDLPF